MLQDESIVCVSSIDWDFNWQGHQEIMSDLARRGNNVLYIENTGIRIPRFRDLPRLGRRLANWKNTLGGIRQVEKHLWVCSPVIVPFPYSRIAGWVNRHLLYRTIRAWSRLVGSKRSILWSFLPTRITLDLIDELDPELVAYYCIADFEELGPPRKVRRSEDALLKRADVVFAQGETLGGRCRKRNGNVHIFPFGVRSELFERVGSNPAPKDLEKIPRPRIGYVGALQRHVDFDLLKTLAKRRPDWSLVLVGPSQEPAPGLHRAGNVFWLGSRSHEMIPSYMAHFDVCLIPYRLNRYTQTVYPTKLHEYLILGKPVVSTALPEVLPFSDGGRSLVRIGKDSREFEACIEEALSEGEVPTLIEERKRVARAHSWSVRIGAMSGLMEAALQKKRLESASQWSWLLRQTSRKSFRRLMGWTTAVLCAYGLIFHTPLLWWTAGPLKLSDPPRQADAIVVFAGGVGESGQAGQGYVERVAHAVWLYQKGFAPRLVFSSGYRFVLDETQQMKTMAVSMGVPSQAIFLERHAGNSRENVIYSAALLREVGATSALVVSSPYHMRRLALVWRKEAQGITPLWSPIPYSHFYGDGSRVLPRHLRAILHEVLGILYYRWKGWI